MRELTIDSLALGQVIVILAGQKSVAITSNNSFNVAIVDIEEKALHCWWMWKLLDRCLHSMLNLTCSKVGSTWSMCT